MTTVYLVFEGGKLPDFMEKEVSIGLIKKDGVYKEVYRIEVDFEVGIGTECLNELLQKNFTFIGLKFKELHRLEI